MNGVNWFSVYLEIFTTEVLFLCYGKVYGGDICNIVCLIVCVKFKCV